MSGLDGRARAMLAAFRDATSPSVHAGEAGLRAVERRIVAAPEREEPIAVVRAPIGFYVQAGAIAVAIAAVVLLVTGAVARTFVRTEVPALDQASDVVPLVAPIELPVPPSMPVEVRRASPPTTVVPAVAMEPVRAARAPRSAAPSAPRSRSDLAAEVALLRAAKREADASAALALLAEHARDFPDGALAPERDALRAERLCALGRTSESRAIAERLLRTHAGDPLAERMKRVCVVR